MVRSRRRNGGSRWSRLSTRSRTFSNEYPPGTVEGSKMAVAATCMWFVAVSRYRNDASIPVSRCMAASLLPAGVAETTGAPLRRR